MSIRPDVGRTPLFVSSLLAKHDCPTHGKTPDEMQAEVVLIRSGEPSNACRVRCYTEDLSGQASHGQSCAPNNPETEQEWKLLAMRCYTIVLF